MPIFFNDSSEDIQFDYYETLPTKMAAKNKVNMTALFFYGMYRNSIYDSYKLKPDLAKDIKERKNEYQENAGSTLSQSALYLDPLYHYSVAASLGAMQEWKDSNPNMKCYIASQSKDGRQSKIGFVHFTEQVVDGKPVIYIAQAGVSNRGQGIGRRLMECVLSHYPAGTEFYILTRVFNTEAKNLYEKRLGFKPISEAQVQQLGLDNRYCGFNHTTTLQEVEAIKAKQANEKQAPRNKKASSFSGNAVKIGLFAATIAAAGVFCYKVFKDSSCVTPRPGK